MAGYKKEDATSPTVHNESVFITAAIDANEGRDVMILDIPGAFLHALTKDEIIMLLRGPLAETMVLIDPERYRPYITYDKKGVPILYVKVNKALYGLLRSALDFYLKLRGELEEKGYEINPYDPCVANKVINGSQHTVIWHVDDLKCSHKKAFVNTKFATWLGSIYGAKLTVKRGKTHDYLGMDLDWSVGGKVTISMIKYVYKILEDFIEVISRTAATPARDNLFQVRAEELAEELPEELAVAFHHAVAQLLFLSLRARRDIQLPTAFFDEKG
jgi:hypothetical protein